jgi:glycine/D-amino acid oxidase-like deaminating enzyme
VGNDLDKRVVVIGAGIVGASLAYHLVRKGAKVTVVEADGVASGVTGTSFAWINATHGEADPIAPLRGAAIAEYRHLETQLPGLKVRWTGALSYRASSTEALPGSGNPASKNGVSRSQIIDLEPNLKHPPESASYVADEGALDAVQATHALIAGAQAHGAKVLTHTRVLGFAHQDAVTSGIASHGTAWVRGVVRSRRCGRIKWLARSAFQRHIPIDSALEKVKISPTQGRDSACL